MVLKYRYNKIVRGILQVRWLQKLQVSLNSYTKLPTSYAKLTPTNSKLQIHNLDGLWQQQILILAIKGTFTVEVRSKLGYQDFLIGLHRNYLYYEYVL
jgi:tRNA U54 and U55 pseudouridine synthase Pus10